MFCSDIVKTVKHPGLDDLLQIRSPGVVFYALRHEQAVYVIDGGFIGGIRHLDHSLQRAGWGDLPIRGVLVTHGHLDHIQNVTKIARMHGAWVAAPALDLAHFRGCPSYAGWARVCGGMETIGRTLFGFDEVNPDILLHDGDSLDIWEGLQAIHLPGHTLGHMGFYSPSRQLLFSADLFASGKFFTVLPPPIFNMKESEIPQSVAKALALNLVGVAPNHCDSASYGTHLDRLRSLGVKLGL